MKTSTRLLPILTATLVLVMACGTRGHAADQPEQSTFTGKNVEDWRMPHGTWSVVGGLTLDIGAPRDFLATPGEGVLLNSATSKTSNLISTAEFGDVEAHVEFCVPRGSNSGVYFMGRYEVQIFDSWGVTELHYTDCGGIYARWNKEEKRKVEGHPPRSNASKPAGEWQTFDVVFRAPRFDISGKKLENARFVKVVHNGTIIHENVEVTGPTNGAAFADEAATGPLMLQGDHGPVAFRNLQIKAVEIK
jgi:hypothetical protein